MACTKHEHRGTPWNTAEHLVCKTKQHRQIRCSGVFRGVPVFLILAYTPVEIRKVRSMCFVALYLGFACFLGRPPTTDMFITC